MTKIDLDKTVYASFFSGLSNYDDKTLSLSVPSQTLDGTAIPSDSYTDTTFLSLDRAYAVTDTRIRFTGLDNVSYVVRGGKELGYNGSNRRFALGSIKYYIDIFFHYENNRFNLFLKIIPNDFSDSSINVPAFTANVTFKLFLPPFEES